MTPMKVLKEISRDRSGYRYVSRCRSCDRQDDANNLQYVELWARAHVERNPTHRVAIEDHEL